jgi:hypothetical protein
MREIKKGDIVHDGGGVRGRVLKVEHIPVLGSGYTAHDDIYVEWLIPGDPDPIPSQEKHGY